MKTLQFHIALVVAAFGIGLAVFSFTARTSRGQSSRPRSKSPVKPTVLIADTKSTDASISKSTPFGIAADRNAILRNDLRWTFGSKQQRGWYLYELLIKQTLDTQKDASTPDFAEAVSSWQKKTGLIPSGILDQDTLMVMVSQWQNNRLKNRAYASPDQLVAPPPSEFYDPERPAELRQVDRNAYVAYKRMIEAAIADPTLKLARKGGELAPAEKYFKIVSSFRSREYQDKLRRESPNAGSAGLAVNSPHFTGRALDLYVGGDPVDTKDSNRAIQVNTPAYKWLVRNAERFGFRPYFYEPWHWEYVK